MASNDTDTIKLLLEKYLEGDTSLEEERLLREYFASGNVDSEFSYAVPMFVFFGNNAAEGYAGKVENAVTESCSYGEENAGRECAGTPDAFLPETVAGIKKGHIMCGKSRRLLYLAVSAAAAIAVVFGSYMAVRTKAQPQVYCYINGEPVTDINVAVSQAEFAARIMNSGLEATGQGVEAVEAVRKSTQSLDAVFNALDKVNEIIAQSE